MNNSEPLNVQDRIKAVMSEIDRAFADILDATEQAAEAADHLGDTKKSAETSAEMIDKIHDANARIVAVCSSQDVIRQHLDFFAKDIGDIDLKSQKQTDDEKLLAGPQVDGQGLSQQDIDSMFD